ncbi:Putative translation elongation factor Tu family protein [Zea mays]|uniref:Putative translation elongation factor Tu family protein n=1 Tax=Zea mays TaxID=4577 RepID=A0A1D6M1Q8_MAIZE|nr:Putative translation elongation factor Tu family protein [Zea mays]
MFVTFESYGMW